MSPAPTTISYFPEIEAQLQRLLATAQTQPEHEALTAELEAGYRALTATSPNHLPPRSPAR